VTVATGRQTPIWPRRLSRPPHDWTSSKYQHQLTDYRGEGIIIRVADSGLLSEPDRGGRSVDRPLERPDRLIDQSLALLL
jgi:hypothetical protein